ncbi:MAG: hypothetical protein F6J87_20615 [Spirulina sp. SIO3F2]|nr:hypothetical protein [Spirulina sp. SIO3F2]
MNDATEITASLKHVIETAIANAETRTTEIIAFQAIKHVAFDPELREQAIAAYRAGQLETLQEAEGDIAGFLVSAIAEWATE